jgi:uncharacterized membrane protein YsdA (DUF1294 family)
MSKRPPKFKLPDPPEQMLFVISLLCGLIGFFVALLWMHQP